MAANADGNEGEQKRSGSWIGDIVRIVLIAALFNILMRNFITNPSTDSNSIIDAHRDGSSITKSRSVSISSANKGSFSKIHANLWAEGTEFDLHVYVTKSENFSFAVLEQSDQLDEALIWHELGLSYSWSQDNERSLNVTMPNSILGYLQTNGTAYAHTFFCRSGHLPREWETRQEKLQVHQADDSGQYDGGDDIDKYELASRFPKKHAHNRLNKRKINANSFGSITDFADVIHSVHPISRHRAKAKLDFRKNLISGDFVDERVASLVENNDADNQNEQDVDQSSDDSVSSIDLSISKIRDRESRPELVVYWKPVLTIRLVLDHTRFSRGGIPANMVDHFNLDQDTGHYVPIVYFDDFWLTTSQLILVNETVTELPLTINYGPIGMIKWQLELAWEQSQENNRKLYGSSEEEGEWFKKLLSETSPWLLATGGIIVVLHTVFDCLAFKNDISFWRNNKNMKGLSMRSLLMGATCQFIIFLYLLDSEETNWMILFSAGMALTIDVWKVRKFCNFDFEPQFPFIALSYKTDKIDSKTTQLDDEAMRKLSYLLYPLVFLYAIYALVYNNYKSWYSWLIGSLVGCVYTFGFIRMCPQIFINYRLKTVAAMPWRMMTYKALNTFIDDFFAFIITMPTMHRISAFRDDIIFLIFLYQKWAYKTDPTRVNEFGYVAEPAADNDGDKKQRDEAEETEFLLRKKREDSPDENENGPAPRTENQDKLDSSPPNDKESVTSQEGEGENSDDNTDYTSETSGSEQSRYKPETRDASNKVKKQKECKKNSKPSCQVESDQKQQETGTNNKNRKKKKKSSNNERSKQNNQKSTDNNNGKNSGKVNKSNGSSDKEEDDEFVFVDSDESLG